MIRIFNLELSMPAPVKNGFVAKNITPEITETLSESGIRNGSITIQSMHTTFGIAVNECESGLLVFDIPDILSRIASEGRPYVHDDLTVRTENLDPDHPERSNGHSHCRAILIPTSVHLIIENGAIALGKWQSILALELDGPRPTRKIKVCLMGE